MVIPCDEFLCDADEFFDAFADINPKYLTRSSQALEMSLGFEEPHLRILFASVGADPFEYGSAVLKSLGREAKMRRGGINPSSI
jgi:hypothetical protein